jgi:hypothetical protein
MKNKNLLFALLAALLVVIGAFIFLTRAPAPLPTSKAEPESTAPPAASVPALTAPPAVAQAPIKSQPTATTPDLPVLATVNGVPIGEKDLDPTVVADPQQPQAKQAMLERAIDRELIRQAAEAQGVQLTSEQKAQLAALPDGVINSGALDVGKAPGPEQRLQTQINMRMREATAQFLLSTLAQPPIQAAPEAIPSQEERNRTYLEGLRAAAKIEVRP